ncbi:hypothetical protein D3C80_1417440 [compost metagenome]
MQLWQQHVQRFFPRRHNTGIGGYARQRENARQFFDCGNVGSIEIKFHDQTLKISLP